ncbi:MAG: putative PEP-binding protein, partial [Candidatus Omnitrophota bacterium]
GNLPAGAVHLSAIFPENREIRQRSKELEPVVLALEDGNVKVARAIITRLIEGWMSGAVSVVHPKKLPQLEQFIRELLGIGLLDQATVDSLVVKIQEENESLKSTTQRISIPGQAWRAEIRLQLTTETKFTEILEVLSGVITDRTSRKAAANQLAAALRTGKIGSFEDIQAIVGPSVSEDKLKTIFKLPGSLSRAPPVKVQKLPKINRAFLALAAVGITALLAVFVIPWLRIDRVYRSLVELRQEVELKAPPLPYSMAEHYSLEWHGVPMDVIAGQHGTSKAANELLMLSKRILGEREGWILVVEGLPDWRKAGKEILVSDLAIADKMSRDLNIPVEDVVPLQGDLEVLKLLTERTGLSKTEILAATLFPQFHDHCSMMVKALIARGVRADQEPPFETFLNSFLPSASIIYGIPEKEVRTLLMKTAREISGSQVAAEKFHARTVTLRGEMLKARNEVASKRLEALVGKYPGKKFLVMLGANHMTILGLDNEMFLRGIQSVSLEDLQWLGGVIFQKPRSEIRDKANSRETAVKIETTPYKWLWMWGEAGQLHMALPGVGASPIDLSQHPRPDKAIAVRLSVFSEIPAVALEDVLKIQAARAIPASEKNKRIVFIPKTQKSVEAKDYENWQRVVISEDAVKVARNLGKAVEVFVKSRSEQRGAADYKPLDPVTLKKMTDFMALIQRPETAGIHLGLFLSGVEMMDREPSVILESIRDGDVEKAKRNTRSMVERLAQWNAVAPRHFERLRLLAEKLAGMGLLDPKYLKTLQEELREKEKKSRIKSSLSETQLIPIIPEGSSTADQGLIRSEVSGEPQKNAAVAGNGVITLERFSLGLSFLFKRGGEPIGKIDFLGSVNFNKEAEQIATLLSASGVPVESNGESLYFHFEGSSQQDRRVFAGDFTGLQQILADLPGSIRPESQNGEGKAQATRSEARKKQPASQSPDARKTVSSEPAETTPERKGMVGTVSGSRSVKGNIVFLSPQIHELEWNIDASAIPLSLPQYEYWMAQIRQVLSLSMNPEEAKAFINEMSLNTQEKKITNVFERIHKLSINRKTGKRAEDLRREIQTLYGYLDLLPYISFPQVQKQSLLKALENFESEEQAWRDKEILDAFQRFRKELPQKRPEVSARWLLSVLVDLSGSVRDPSFNETLKSLTVLEGQQLFSDSAMVLWDRLLEKTINSETLLHDEHVRQVLEQFFEAKIDENQGNVVGPIKAIRSRLTQTEDKGSVCHPIAAVINAFEFDLNQGGASGTTGEKLRRELLSRLKQSGRIIKAVEFIRQQAQSDPQNFEIQIEYLKESALQLQKQQDMEFQTLKGRHEAWESIKNKLSQDEKTLEEYQARKGHEIPVPRDHEEALVREIETGREYLKEHEMLPGARNRFETFKTMFGIEADTWINSTMESQRDSKIQLARSRGGTLFDSGFFEAMQTIATLSQQISPLRASLESLEKDESEEAKKQRLRIPFKIKNLEGRIDIANSVIRQIMLAVTLVEREQQKPGKKSEDNKLVQASQPASLKQTPRILVVREAVSEDQIEAERNKYGGEVTAIVATMGDKTTHWVQMVRGRPNPPTIIFLSEKKFKVFLDALKEGQDALVLLREGGEAVFVPDPDAVLLKGLEGKQKDEERLSRGEVLLSDQTSHVPALLTLDTRLPNIPKEIRTKGAGLIRTDVMSHEMKREFRGITESIASQQFNFEAWWNYFSKFPFASVQYQKDIDKLQQDLIGTISDKEVVHLQTFLAQMRAAYGEILQSPFFRGKPVSFRTMDIADDSKTRDLLEIIDAAHKRNPEGRLIKDAGKPVTGFNFYRNTAIGKLVLTFQMAALLQEQYQILVSDPEHKENAPILAILFPMVDSVGQLDFIQKEILPVAEKLAVWNLVTERTPKAFRRTHKKIAQVVQQTRFGSMVEMRSLLQNPSKRKEIIEHPFVSFFNFGTNDLAQQFWSAEIGAAIRRDDPESGYFFSRLHPKFVSEMNDFVQDLDAYNSTHLGNGKEVRVCGVQASNDEAMELFEKWRRQGTPVSVSVSPDDIPRVRHVAARMAQVDDKELDAVFDKWDPKDRGLESRTKNLAARWLQPSRGFLNQAQAWQERYQQSGFYYEFYRADIDPLNGIGSIAEFDQIKALFPWLVQAPWNALRQRKFPDAKLTAGATMKPADLSATLQALRQAGFLFDQEKTELEQAYKFLSNVQTLFSSLKVKYPDRFKGVLHPENLDEFLKEYERVFQKETAWLPPLGDQPSADMGQRRQEEFYIEYYRHASNVFNTAIRIMHEGYVELFPPDYRHVRRVFDLQTEKGSFQIEEQWRHGVMFERDAGFIMERVNELSIPQNCSNLSEILIARPELILEIFKATAEPGRTRPLRISYELQRNLVDAIDRLPRFEDLSDAQQQAVHKAFQELLMIPTDISYAMWRLHRFGFLEKYFPAYANVRSSFSGGDQRYSVHMQVLRAFDFMEKAPMSPDFVTSSVASTVKGIRGRDTKELLATVRLATLIDGISRVRFKEVNPPSRQNISELVHEVLRGRGIPADW